MTEDAWNELHRNGGVAMKIKVEKKKAVMEERMPGGKSHPRQHPCLIKTKFFVGIVDGLIERINNCLALSSRHPLLHHCLLLLNLYLHRNSTVPMKFVPGVLGHLWHQLLENGEHPLRS